MIIIFGGRGDKNAPLNDCWGLRRHRSGNWDWVKAPYTKEYEPKKRFQHTIAFYYNFLIVIGGRNDIDMKMIPIEIYDTETSEWESVAFFNKFRHTSWLVDNSMYTHGGFELQNTVVAKNDIIKIDLVKLFNSNETLKRKFEKVMEEEKKRKLLAEMESKSKTVTPTMSPINNSSTNQKIKPSTIKIKPSQTASLPMSSISIMKLIEVRTI